MSKKAEIYIMYFCAGLTLCVMYGVQPIQPVFMEILGISKFEASLFTTSILVPLAIASIVYGYILEKFSIKKILVFAFFAFGVLELMFAFCNDYYFLLNIRGLQGLIAPAALTGIMSYISTTTSKENVASAIGVYVGITILGGFIGRFLSGLSYDIFGSWRVFFAILGVVLLMSAFMLTKISSKVSVSPVKPKLGDIFKILKFRSNALIVAYIFCLFFSFTAVLNFLPFELNRLDGGFNGTKTGLIYFGYFIGVLVAFNVNRIVVFFGNAPKAMFIGAIIFITGLFFLEFDKFWIIFCAMLVVCFGNFIGHSIASGYINRINDTHKGIANGLYVSIYYLGGSLGSIVPSFIYTQYGWKIFLISIGILVVISLIFSGLLNVKR